MDSCFINQCADIVHISHDNATLFIEDSARICYASHDKVKPGSDKKLVSKLLASGHETPFEFVDIVVDFTCDLNTSHQLVRHRMITVLQESKRYVRLENVGAKFIIPIGFDQQNPMWKIWMEGCQKSFDAYCEMIAFGAQPQQARRVLPGSLATHIRIKANIREWMHIMKLRHSKAADPQMYALMDGLLPQFQKILPDLFSISD